MIKARRVQVRSIVFMTIGVALFCSQAFSASSSPRGTISGAVKVDQGQVRAFRVRAHNLDAHIWYVVFTKNGRYAIPDALSGPYEIHVEQEGYSAPVEKRTLTGGETLRVDLSAAKQPPPDMQYLDYNQLYPPGPGRDLLEKTCMGCHGRDFYNRQQFTEQGWRAAVHKMFNGPLITANNDGPPPLGQTQMDAKDRETIIQYLNTNFGADSAKRDLKRYAYEPDEEAISKAIYVEYDAPPFNGPMNNQKFEQFHDPYIVPRDGTIWLTSAGWNSMVHLDPRETDPDKRWHTYLIDSPSHVLGLHGLCVDSRGIVYWSEITGGRVGQLDPATGKIVRHKLSTTGSLLQVACDEKNQAVWYDLIHGNALGRVNMETGGVDQWPIPTPDASPYGLIVDHQGNPWAAGVAKGLLIEFDPKEQVYTEYTPPTRYAGVRRLGEDSKGMIWFTEYRVGQLGFFDPKSEKFREYPFPLPYTHPYEAWPDKSDNIWVTDHFYNALIKFDPKTQKFTYYPDSQLHVNVPKLEVESNNTMWSGSRGADNWVVVHYYPNGYSKEAPPEP